MNLSFEDKNYYSMLFITLFRNFYFLGISIFYEIKEQTIKFNARKMYVDPTTEFYSELKTLQSDSCKKHLNQK